MNILPAYFCAISFNRTQNLQFPRNSGKIVATVPLANYARINFYAISFNRTQNLQFSKEISKIANASLPSILCPQKMCQCHILM